MASSSLHKPQSVQLRCYLIKQLKRHELHQITDSFIDALIEKNLLQEKNIEQIADYLVHEQRSSHELLTAITCFLQTADELSQTKVNIELAKDLLAYLLQTLVNESEINTDGVNKVSVNYIPTVKLIYAAEKGITVIPDYDDREYRAGKRNARFENVGDFQPRNAHWTPESVCEDIAEKILEMLCITHRSDQGALHTLKSSIVMTEYDAEKSPLHGIFIEEKFLNSHPFSYPEVVQHFVEMTEARLPIYIYNVQQLSDEFQNLKIDEEDLLGYLSSDYKLLKHDTVSKSHTISAGPAISIKNEIHAKEVIMHQGQGDIIFLKQDTIEQLQQKIPGLIQQIEQANNITDNERKKITYAVEIVEQAIANQGKVEKEKISDAQRIFGVYAETFGFAGSIASILQFFT